ncbi:hypothetical protein DMC30DRAFT_388511 [Rhodotorula diobovata]|uniref:Uncharacterized protein n=1 Tax=Rhodotorula diobovata TaxID=5288 RepID=A0A5C5G4E8_9BASI|nr:hypothetical protein DMC30DRAFT_388511 [Rhodotorula diobovata]
MVQRADRAAPRLPAHGPQTRPLPRPLHRHAPRISPPLRLPAAAPVPAPRRRLHRPQPDRRRGQPPHARALLVLGRRAVVRPDGHCGRVVPCPRVHVPPPPRRRRRRGRRRAAAPFAPPAARRPRDPGGAWRARACGAHAAARGAHACASGRRRRGRALEGRRGRDGPAEWQGERQGQGQGS